jgi:hypothetical protein
LALLVDALIVATLYLVAVQALSHVNYAPIFDNSVHIVQSLQMPTITSSMVSTPQTYQAAQPAPSFTNINISNSAAGQGTPKPIDAPSGTKPIDKVGLPRDVIHKIKDPNTGIGARPNDWVGVTPDGDVVTAGPDGKTINHGPADAWQY